jgi:hypothetical protein
MSEENLAGEYTLKVGTSLADGSHKVPGDRIVLSHEDAKRFLADGNVVDPTVNPEGDPHDSADHIMTLPEFIRWMTCQYPRYVEDRKAKRERNRIVDQIRRGQMPTQEQATALAKDLAPPAPPTPAAAAPDAIDIPDGAPEVTESPDAPAPTAEPDASTSAPRGKRSKMPPIL